MSISNAFCGAGEYREGLAADRAARLGLGDAGVKAKVCGGGLGLIWCLASSTVFGNCWNRARNIWGGKHSIAYFTEKEAQEGAQGIFKAQKEEQAQGAQLEHSQWFVRLF